MFSIQAKIVGDFCNLRCAYCRDRDFDQYGKRVMSKDLLSLLIDSLSRLPKGLHRVHWLGGEPILAGLDFFKEIVRLQTSYENKEWINTIQTNATLINREWAEFFHTSGFKVGVSIDGTPEIHNANRKNINGSGSYTKAMEGVISLRNLGIFPPVICVITKSNAHLGAEILRGLVSSGFTDISFNAFYNTATNFSCDPFSVSDELWTRFLKDVFDEWVLMDRVDVQVREIDSALAWVRGRVSRSCAFRGTCLDWLLVDYDGKVYPCERLGRGICFGEISSDFFLKIKESPEYNLFSNQNLHVPDKCSTCSMKKSCNNGCVAHRVADKNNSAHYAYCNSRLVFYDYITERLGMEKPSCKQAQNH